MALVLADRVKVRSRSTGTGTITLENPVTGYQSFAVIGDGNDTYYGIVDARGNWEIGQGTYTHVGTTLSRNTVISSSNSGNLVNFPAGSKNVYCTFPSSALESNILDLSGVSQNILPSIDSDGTTGYTLGSPSFKWKELFVSNGSIYIGDVKLSNLAGKLKVTKVVRPGEDDEEEDTEDSEADSEIKAVNKLVNNDHEFALTTDGTLTLDGDPFTGAGGSGVDGLTGNTDYSPDSEGGIRYSLGINGDIQLRTYEPGNGANDLGSGISLGNTSSPIRSGVISIGNNDVGYNSKQGGVYIGYQAGWNNDEDPQGEFAIAIGAFAARNFAQDNSITLNATGEHLDPTADGLYIKPIREVVENTAKALYYDTLTGEVSYADSTGSSSADPNVWVQTFATPDGQTADNVVIATSVEYDSTGNVIALFVHNTDYVDNQPTGSYYSVAKFTAAGDKLWQTRLSSTNTYTDGWGLALDTADDQIYVAGRVSVDGSYDKSSLVKLSGNDGSLIWSNIYDFGDRSDSPVVDVDSDGNPIMVGYYSTDVEDNDGITITKISSVDGSVVWSRLLDGQGDDEAYGMAVGPAGEVVAVGYMDRYTEPASHSITPQTGSATDVLVINRSDLGSDTLTTDWLVSGTGITGTVGISQINTYNALTGTVRQGSGAIFDIADNGDGTYLASGVQNNGTNYLAGHKILVLGTDLGGATPANDCTITVDSVSEGGAIFNWSVSGTAAGSVFALYTPVNGTNYQTGSGLTFDFFGDSGSTYTEQSAYIISGGTNYVNGDVVTIPGTQLGGTTPTNDLIATVSTADGVVTQFTMFSGNAQTTTYRILVTNSTVDYSGVGTWTLSTTFVDQDDRMTVVKYDSAGVIQWQKAIQFDAGYDCTGADADIDADGNIYVCGNYNYTNGSAMNIVKFNSSGVKQWSRRVVGDCDDFATSIVVGPDNNLYLSGVTLIANTQRFVWAAAKYSTSGTVVWQRLLENTQSWSFTGGWFTTNGGGSNLAVRDGYVAFSGSFGNLANNEPPTATVIQMAASGTAFAAGNWEIAAASFSGTLSSDASDITVVNANKVDSDIQSTISIDSTPFEVDSSAFLEPTLYASGSADTGDITFNGIKIIGAVENDDLNVGGIKLIPNPDYEETGQYVKIYPTMGQDAPHIHIAAGSGGDLILGDDETGIDVNHDDNIYIRTDTGTGNYVWKFGADGGTTFPTLTTTRGDRSGTLTGQTLRFADSTQDVIITTPDGTEFNSSSQRLVINPGQGYGSGEGGDIYLYAGRGGVDNGSGGDIKIRGGQGGGTGQGGYIDINGGEGETNGGYVNIIGGQGNAGAGGDVLIEGGYGAATDRGGNVVIRGGYGANEAPEGSITLESNNNQLTLDYTGKLTIPGAVVKSTVAKTGATIPTTTGELLILTQDSVLTNLTDSTYGPFTLGVVTFSVVVSGGSILAYNTISSTGDVTVGDTLGTIDSGDLGGTPGITISWTVSAVVEETPTALDLTKSVNKLTDGAYTLADGVEGQIMSLVLQTGVTNVLDLYVVVANARNPYNTVTNWWLYPFTKYDPVGMSNVQGDGVCTLIFTDGAWQSTTGLWAD